MNDEFEDKVKAAFKSASLPAAPDSLHQKAADVTVRARTEPARPTRSGWLLLPAAAILTIVAGFALFFVGSRLSIGPVATATPTASGQMSPTAGPTQSAASSATPAGPTAQPAFETAAPPAAGAPWTSLIWRQLGSDDPLRSVQRVVRWSGGFVAIGQAVATADGSRTPLWTSTDGADWFTLPADVVGANGVAVAATGVGNSVVLLTVVGRPDTCVGSDQPCWATAGPLSSWVSTNGTSWSAHGAALPVAVHLDEQTVRPIVLIGNGTTAVLVADGALATTQDGVSWSRQQQALAAADQIESGAAVGGGFLLAGVRGCPTSCAGLVLWSADGVSWQEQHVFAGVSGVIKAGVVASGGGGVIVSGQQDLIPGPTLWWTSTDGRTWQRSADLAPLGVWNGPGEGSGLLPNGEIVGDGERMLAYDTVDGGKAWHSFDGTDWTQVAVAGAQPAPLGFPSDVLSVTPIGLRWDDDQGGVWFAEPAVP